MTSQSEPTTSSVRQKSFWSLTFIGLRYRNFRLVWLGSVTEHTGEFMEIAAILWLVNELTHSPLWLTVVGSCRFISMIFFPPLGGVVAERIDRRRLLIVSLIGSTLLSTCLAVLAVTGIINLVHLIVISLLSGVAMSFNHPARQTIVPNLVNREHLLNAISLDTLSVHMSRATGNLIVGYLMVFLGIWPIFVIRAVGCLIAITLLLQARVPATPPATRTEAPWRNLAQGFRYLRGNRLMLILVILYALPYMAQNTYINFLPVFANDILRVGAVGYGYLQGAPGIGAIIFMILLGLMTYYKNKFRLLIGSGILLSIGLLSLSASPWFALSLPLIVIIGGMVTVFAAVETTLIQGTVSDEVRGRVLSWREILFGLGPTGSILFGAIAQYTGVPYALGMLGIICLVVSLLLIFLYPRFKGMD